MQWTAFPAGRTFVLQPPSKLQISMGENAMHRKLAVFALLVAAPLAAPAVGQDWTKSKWGPADEIGAANYIKPELVVKAAQLVKTGKTYALGHRDEFEDAGLSAARLQDHDRAAGAGGHRRVWVRARPPTTTTSSMAGSASAARSTASVTSVWSMSTTTATSSPISPMPSGLKKLGAEKIPPHRCARRAARHGGALRHRHRQGGHRLQHQGDRRGCQKAGRRNPAGRCRAVPYRLDRPDRQGRQALQRGRAGSWRRRCQVPRRQGVVAVGADTGASRRCPSRPRTSSRCTRSCCP